MPSILSVSTYAPPYALTQRTASAFVRELFKDSFQDIDRLLKVFANGQIEKRHFCVPLEWFTKDQTLQARNDLYIALATDYGAEAVERCLRQTPFLRSPVSCDDIDAIFFISSTGMATPSIEARIMNRLPFSPHTKRIPIWGLGCGGGAAGLARAYEYCLAFPAANVLVLSVELCSLTFQRNDKSKGNLIGTSLFADGVACALVAGEHSKLQEHNGLGAVPQIVDAQTTFLPESEDVMGWEVKDNGLYVVFSKDIPSLIRRWLQPNALAFLAAHDLTMGDIQNFIAHPGGRKVLEAYEEALQIPPAMTAISRGVLREFGNMSSATVFFVLERLLQKAVGRDELGLMVAVGPGFSSEFILLRWK